MRTKSICLLELEKGLNKAFIETLRGVGLNLAKDVVAEITSNKIEITVLNEKGSKLFGSGVTLCEIVVYYIQKYIAFKNMA